MTVQGSASRHDKNGRTPPTFQKEHIGKLDFVSGYIPVTDSTGKDVAYLNIPYFISQTKLKEEMSNDIKSIL